jgi:hypothetical protein
MERILVNSSQPGRPFSSFKRLQRPAVAAGTLLHERWTCFKRQVKIYDTEVIRWSVGLQIVDDDGSKDTELDGEGIK